MDSPETIERGTTLTISGHDPRAGALAAAIQTGDVAGLRRWLLDEPTLAHARIVDGRGVGRTLLHVATDWPGHFPNGAETVRILAMSGADVDAPVENAPGHAETPLHWAASSDDVAVLDALLDVGANIEAQGAVITGGSPLSDAIVFAQWRAARRLVERGAKTTLWQAAALGLLDRVAHLCEAEPRPSQRDITNAFWNACRGGQRTTAEYLLEQGAEVNWIGHDRKTPLEAARESGHNELAQWLAALESNSGPEALPSGDRVPNAAQEPARD